MFDRPWLSRRDERRQNTRDDDDGSGPVTGGDCQPLASFSVYSTGVLANAENNSARPCARHRLFSWPLLFLCSFVLRRVVGRHEFEDSTAITRRLNDWALLMLLSSPCLLVKATFQSWLFCVLASICNVLLRSHGPGVPAAGIDPTAEVLQQLGDVAGIFSWLASAEPVRTGVIRLLGGGQPRLCENDLWQATVLDLRMPQGETQRDLTALEVGRVAMVRRIARLGRRSTNAKWTGVWCSPV